MSEEIELSSLLGDHVLTGCQYGVIPNAGDYHDANANTIDFILDGETISAIEDPQDGYRSCMDKLIKNRDGLVVTNTFQAVEVFGVREPDEKYRKHDIIHLIDRITFKAVISVGTEDTEDYYPCFVGAFYPENMWMNASK